MKKISITIMVMLLAATLATTAFAFGPGRGPGYGPCGRGDFSGMKGLNLAAEQRTKMKEQRDTQLKEIRPLQEQMITKRDALRKLWLEPNPDQAKITAAQKEMNAIRDQIQEKMTATQLATLNVLTPEQKEKMKAYADCRGFGKRGGMGPAGRGCFGGGSACYRR